MRTIHKTERDESIAQLRKWLKPGKTIYTILRHVSRSGMSHSIDLAIIGKDYDGKPDLQMISYHAARAMGDRIDRENGGIKIGGCGMDMGFALVYNLGATLWPKGTRKPHGTRNGEPDTAGGYALKHRWL